MRTSLGLRVVAVPEPCRRHRSVAPAPELRTGSGSEPDPVPVSARRRRHSGSCRAGLSGRGSAAVALPGRTASWSGVDCGAGPLSIRGGSGARRAALPVWRSPWLAAAGTPAGLLDIMRSMAPVQSAYIVVRFRAAVSVSSGWVRGGTWMRRPWRPSCRRLVAGWPAAAFSGSLVAACYSVAASGSAGGPVASRAGGDEIAPLRLVHRAPRVAVAVALIEASCDRDARSQGERSSPEVLCGDHRAEVGGVCHRWGLRLTSARFRRHGLSAAWRPDRGSRGGVTAPGVLGRYRHCRSPPRGAPSRVRRRPAARTRGAVMPWVNECWSSMRSWRMKTGRVHRVWRRVDHGPEVETARRPSWWHQLPQARRRRLTRRHP